MKTTGERIREAREERGLTRPKLEELSGIPRTRLQTLEVKNVAPTIREAKALSAALRVGSAAYFMGAENQASTTNNPIEPPTTLVKADTLSLDGIAKELVTKFKLNESEAMDFLVTFFDDVKKKINDGEAVRLSGFGTLKKVTDRSTKKIKIKFTPSPSLAARVQKVLN